METTLFSPSPQAVYRRLSPLGLVKPSTAGDGSVGPDSIFVMSFLQASWSSERKIRLHLEALRRYCGVVLEDGLAVRADLLQAPDYPSAHKIWHHFPDT